MLSSEFITINLDANAASDWQWFCQSGLHGELVEFLQGLRRRCDKLGVSPPELFTVDDCCKLRKPVILVFSAALVVLDVWHFLTRRVRSPGSELVKENLLTDHLCVYISIDILVLCLRGRTIHIDLQ